MTNEDQPIITRDGWEDTAAEGQRALNEVKGKELLLFDFNWIAQLLRLDKAAKVLGDHIRTVHGRRGI